MNRLVMAPGDSEYIFEVEPSIQVEPYECADYRGVKFTDEVGSVYDVVLNPHFGPRLIFNLKHGAWNDVPFKEQTYGFLPRSIRVRRQGV